jgi:hypothetical protein
MYYKFIPVWKDNSRETRWATFVGNDSIVRTNFASIKDGIEAMRLDGTCLREKNWEVLECSCFGMIQKKIMLKTLYDMGYFSRVISSDNISSYYSF